MIYDAVCSLVKALVSLFSVNKKHYSTHRPTRKREPLSVSLCAACLHLVFRAPSPCIVNISYTYMYSKGCPSNIIKIFHAVCNLLGPTSLLKIMQLSFIHTIERSSSLFISTVLTGFWIILNHLSILLSMRIWDISSFFKDILLMYNLSSHWNFHFSTCGTWMAKEWCPVIFVFPWLLIQRKISS